MGRLITGAGYTGTIGGTITVYGTPERQTITVADVAGTVTFDPSFNKGGDTIVLTKSAAAYTIAQSGSTIVLSDGNSRIVIPVGTTANTIQFSDGDRTLLFSGGVKIGGQSVTSTATAVTAIGATKSSLAPDNSTAPSRLLVNAEAATVGGNVMIFGTSSAETVKIYGQQGSVTFDASFNRGNDKITLTGLPEEYYGNRSGSSLVLSRGDQRIAIPVGTKRTEVEFSNGPRELLYTNGSVFLGNQALSGSSSQLTNFETNLVFKKVDNAFLGSMPLPGAFQIIVCAAAIDVNGDGYQDIVFQAWEKVIGERASTNIGNVPTPNKISILINHEGKYFSEETSKYLIGSASLSGAARKIEIGDLNGDGKLDLLFANNREDGRAGTPYENNTAYMDVLLSTPDGYIIKSFGKEDWYHSAGFASFSGKAYAMGAGFLHGSPGRSDMQGGFEVVGKGLNETLKLPFQLSPNNFMFFSSPGSEDTDYLIQTAAAPNVLGVEGWQLKAGQWTKVGQFDTPGTFIKNVTVKTYNGNTQDGQIYKLDGEFIVTGIGNAITESSQIDIFNDGRLAVVMKLEAPIVKNFDEMTTTLVDQMSDTNGIIAGDKLVFFTIENGALKQLDIKIIGAPKTRNANLLNIIDFNNDGYQDIVLSPFLSSALPDVYLNNQNGTFTRVDLKLDTPMNYRLDGFSLVDDFNNDGIVDLISMPGNGIDSVDAYQMTAFAYYIGSNSLVI